MPEATNPDTEAGLPWATEKLATKRHDRKSFSCGVQALDDYLQRQAAQDERRRISVTYILEDPANPERIRGYYTLTSTSANLGDLPDDMVRKLPSYPIVSAILLARLAVDERDRGQGLGGILLVDAIRRAYNYSASIGAALVVVEAKGEQAISFYKHYGFRTFPDRDHQLFMPMLEARHV